MRQAGMQGNLPCHACWMDTGKGSLPAVSGREVISLLYSMHQAQTLSQDLRVLGNSVHNFSGRPPQLASELQP